MITLKDAIKIAEEWSSKFDAYQEYEDAYEFYVDDGIITVGGAERNLIIDKSTGKRIPWAMYFMDADREIVELGEPVRFKPREKTLKLKYIGESFGAFSLTNGKVYAAKDENEGMYRVIDDSGEDYLYSKDNPAPLDGSSPGGRWEIIAEDDLPAKCYNHLRLNLQDEEITADIKIIGWEPFESEYMESAKWCKVSVSLKSWYLNYDIEEDEALDSVEVVIIKDTLQNWLDGKIDKEKELSFFEPDFELDFYVDDNTRYIEYIIHFVTDGVLMGGEYRNIINEKYEEYIYTYLRYVTQELSDYDLEIRALIDKGILRY